MSKIDEYTKKYLEALQPSVDKAKQDNDTLYANKEKTLRDTAQQEIDFQSQSYEEDARRIEVQKYINEREVAEANANLGLTQSGLNATQMTAVKLSASNNQAKIERDKQNMIKTITHELNSLLAQNENERLAKNSSIEQTAYDQAYSSAVSQYNDEVKAAQEAENKYKAQKNVDYSNLYKHIGENEQDLDYYAKLVDEYMKKYNVDDESAEVTALLKRAGLDIKDLERFNLKNTVYYSDNEYKNASNEQKGQISGRMKNDYTTGTQTYKVIVKKNTSDLFGVGIDRGDIVDICYPDGTVLMENVKLQNLPRDIALKISKNFTNHKSASVGDSKEFSFDLSGLDLQ